MSIDTNELAAIIADTVKRSISKPAVPWDDYVPIIETDDVLSVYITEVISVPGEYNETCTRIRNATKPVNLILNTPGGSTGSAFMITDAMKACKYPIHGVITGSVASAGTVLAMYCDTIEVADYSDFMVHNYSHGAAGSGAQVKEYVNFADREFSKAVKEIYAGFLTEDEMRQVSEQDKEIWLNKDEVLSRWARKKELEACRTVEEV